MRESAFDVVCRERDELRVRCEAFREALQRVVDAELYDAGAGSKLINAAHLAQKVLDEFEVNK